MAKIRASKKVGLTAKTKAGNPKKRLSKSERDYNNEVDLYKYFVVFNNKIESGYEFKSDAVDEANNYEPKAKVLSLQDLKKAGLENPKNKWKFNIGASKKVGYKSDRTANLPLVTKFMKKYIEQGYSRKDALKNANIDAAYSVSGSQKVGSKLELKKDELRLGYTKEKTQQPKNKIQGLSGYKVQPEFILGKVSDTKAIKLFAPEIKVRITRGKSVLKNKINSSKDVVDILRKYVTGSKVQTQEHSLVMYLNNQNNLLGVYIFGMGGFTSTIMEIRLILGAALKLGATGMILCHNHPSGNLKPSSADMAITKKIKEAGALHDIGLIDHVILTKEDSYSFAENSML